MIIASKKNIETKRWVNFKTEECEIVRFVWAGNGNKVNGEYESGEEFTISAESENKKYRVTLNKAEFLRMMENWKDQA